MKLFYFFSLLLFIINSCNSVDKVKQQNKIFIYSASNDCVNIDWYCYSNVGGFSISKVDFKNKSDKSIGTIESFYLSDIEINKDTLKLQFWNSDTSGINISKISCFKNIKVDTTGNQNKNGIDARVSRIIDAKIDYTKRHNFDSKWKSY